MRIIDISMTIHNEMATYKNRPEKRPNHFVERAMPKDSANETALHMNLHTGTHLDSPLHMIEGGSNTMALPLEKLMTQAKVFDLTQVKDGIVREDLEGLGIRKGDFVLLKTSNSFDPLCGGEDFVFVKESGARYLAELGISGVGIDTLGIERAQAGHETHISLLSRDIIILEGLRLADVNPGEYLLIALPVKIQDAEGAPTRAVLVEGATLQKA